MTQEKDRAIIDFLCEVGQLKREPRHGWLLLGIKQPESVADHTCRSVFIAYMLAQAEGCDPAKAALIAAFHELPETRTGDTTKVAQKYIPDKKEKELLIMREQLADLPPEMRDGFLQLLTDFERDTTPEQVVARDADYLEVMLQAKEYIEQGYAGAQNWIGNTLNKGCLRTETAKRWGKLIVETRSTAWYEGLKRIRR